MYGYGPTYYAGHLPGLFYYQKLENRPRGKTFCNLPLHRSIQYTSLDTSYPLPSSDVISPSSDSFEHKFAKTGDTSHVDCFRSTAPSMAVATMRKTVENNSSISQSNAGNTVTTNWVGNNGDELFALSFKQNAGNQSGKMDELHVIDKTAVSKDGCSRSLDSAWLFRTKSSIVTGGAMARKRTDTVPNDCIDPCRTLEIGDDVQLKIEVNTLNDLPKWIRDKVNCLIYQYWV